MSKEYENGSEDNEVHPINPEEKQDILKSVGALGEQVKANEKSKANANKAKGYAKAKAIGRKYG